VYWRVAAGPPAIGVVGLVLIAAAAWLWLRRSRFAGFDAPASGGPSTAVSPEYAPRDEADPPADRPARSEPP
jgi:hypothetical protein